MCCYTNKSVFFFQYVKEVFHCDLSGTSTKFQAVPGCGLKCVITSLHSTLNNARNNSRDLRDFVNLVSAGSSGLFTLNGVQVEVKKNKFLVFF